MWGWCCSECDYYWESLQPEPSHEWCPNGCITEPERLDIPAEFWPA